jgi:hypothetical protein
MILAEDWQTLLSYCQSGMTTAREIAVPGRYRDGVASIWALVPPGGFSRLTFQFLPDNPASILNGANPTGVGWRSLPSFQVEFFLLRRSGILLSPGKVLICGEE